MYDRIAGRVLDIGVGAARFSLPLQRTGVDVVGLDVSPGAVDVCLRRTLRSAVLGGIDSLGGSERFDSFLLLGKNLGLLESREQGPRLLTRLAEIANPGARIVGTCVDPYLLEGDHHKHYLAANRDSGRMSGQMRLRLRYQQMATEWFDYLFLSSTELEEMVHGTGWSVTDLTREGSGYAIVARRMDVTAKAGSP
ncbi:class I SAM-dependent methyltransferase [Actinocrispum wychmicini]|uniref:Methyltransferase family protein n=1 Tax=Actinocrispum wychmicini TaxID=1213861 RepID=A0A4R2JM33_9PSEU|nr:methyltransferase domain-containing protein [Actinocrispum wychmicini]TCO61153.1 methyltransferase family protein [Actinocrispum wychmicini]